MIQGLTWDGVFQAPEANEWFRASLGMFQAPEASE